MKKYQLAAIATTVALLSSSSDALASGAGFQSITSGIAASANNVPKLLGIVAYIGGIGLGIAGALKLKGHVENPGQTPLKDGLARLGIGGCLLALPTLLEAMSSAVGSGTAVNSNAVDAFSGTSF